MGCHIGNFSWGPNPTTCVWTWTHTQENSWSTHEEFVNLHFPPQFNCASLQDTSDFAEKKHQKSAPLVCVATSARLTCEPATALWYSAVSLGFSSWKVELAYVESLHFKGSNFNPDKLSLSICLNTIIYEYSVEILILEKKKLAYVKVFLT